MATLQEISELLDETGILYHKFRGAIIKAAAAVYGEAEATANHTNRLLWAKDVLLAGNIKKRTEEMYRLGMTNTDIVTNGNASPDTDVEWVVSFFLNTAANGG